MSSGLAWILIGLALVAATGLGAALIHSRARLRLTTRALNALPVSVQIVSGSRVIFSNTACRNEFPDAVTPMAELLRRRAAGEPAEAELARLGQSAGGGRAALAIASASGETDWREVIAEPLAAPLGHVLWLCRDITAERRAEDALRPLVQALEGSAERGAR